MYKHIVLLKWNFAYTDEEMKKHFEEEVKLKERMPELVLDWSWAKNDPIPEDRAKGFTHIVISTFRTREDLIKYLQHPQHIEVKEIQGPMVQDKIVMDIESN